MHLKWDRYIFCLEKRENEDVKCQKYKQREQIYSLQAEYECVVCSFVSTIMTIGMQNLYRYANETVQWFYNWKAPNVSIEDNDETELQNLYLVENFDFQILIIFFKDGMKEMDIFLDGHVALI